MYRESLTSLKFLYHLAVTVLRCLSFMLLLKISDTIKTPDTCGNYFLLPAFPDCQLFLEAVPCANYTHAVFIKMSTHSGETIHSFSVSFGAITRHSLQDINKAKHEGIAMTSNGDISVYIHKALGDSMIVYPTDVLSQEYQIPFMTSFGVTNGSSKNNSLIHGVLYIFSPYNNTTITITSVRNEIPSLQSSSTLSSSSSWKSSSTNITLDAFTIHKYLLDNLLRYRLHSSHTFAVVLVQIYGAFSVNDSICRNNNLMLIDFVPPYSTKGKHFFIAFPNATDFTLIAVGAQNTSIDLTAGQSSTEITTETCADNGFFLPSLDQFFKCGNNMSEEGCVCTCPSVFHRIFDPSDFNVLRNTNESLLTDRLPDAFDEIFDLTVSISYPQDSKNAADVIVTTNTSFMIFRYNLERLNFLPAGNTLQAIHTGCPQDKYNEFTHLCNFSDKAEFENHNSNDPETSANLISENNECLCEFSQGSVNDNINAVKVTPLGPAASKLTQSMADDVFFWGDEEEDSARPLIAVVVSLCVAIFAVIALISGYLLVEIMTRRKHVRNPRIRPFVS